MLLKAQEEYSLFELVKNKDSHYFEQRIDTDQTRLITHIAQNPIRKEDPNRVVVVTDRFEYQGWDQVIPIQPEQLFFYDQMDLQRINGANVLEVGIGSGVLSIKAAKEGATTVVALDINARARNIAGFNATLNGVQNKLDIRHGDVDNIFSPVKGERFDYIISNPPFEPTPEETNYYLNSAAGIYGLDFLEAMFSDLDNHLSSNGYVQIVTMAPGCIKTPFLLTELLSKYFPDQAITVLLDHQPIAYDEFVNRFVDIFEMDSKLIQSMQQQAATDQVTHIHMCMISFIKGEVGRVHYQAAEKLYENWTTPLGKEKPLSP